MLLAFLLGIGLGGWSGGGLADRLFARGQRAAVVRGVVGLQIGVSLLSWGSMYAYGELPVAFVRLYSFLEDARGWFLPAQLLLAMARTSSSWAAMSRYRCGDQSIIDALRNNPAMAADLESVNMPRAEDVLAMYLMSRDILLKLAGDVGLNTDDNMRIEYAAPLHLYDSTTSANFQLLRRSYVVMPTFAIPDGNSWMWMSQACARHNDSVRARLALSAVKKPRTGSRRAGDDDLSGL